MLSKTTTTLFSTYYDFCLKILQLFFDYSRKYFECAERLEHDQKCFCTPYIASTFKEVTLPQIIDPKDEERLSPI